VFGISGHSKFRIEVKYFLFVSDEYQTRCCILTGYSIMIGLALGLIYPNKIPDVARPCGPTLVKSEVCSVS